MVENEIKISRKNLIKRINENDLILKDIREIDTCCETTINLDLQKEIAKIFEDILEKGLTLIFSPYQKPFIAFRTRRTQ